MRNHLMHSRLFSTYHTRTREIYSRELTEKFEELQSTISQEVENIVRDLHAVVAGEGEIPEAQQDPALAELLSSSLETAQEVLGNVQAVLQSLVPPESSNGIVETVEND